MPQFATLTRNTVVALGSPTRLDLDDTRWEIEGAEDILSSPKSTKHVSVGSRTIIMTAVITRLESITLEIPRSWLPELPQLRDYFAELRSVDA